MGDEKILDKRDLEYVAEMLRAIFMVRHELDTTSVSPLRELEEALPRAEEALRACAQSMK